MKKSVVLGLSGGVDSAVGARLLLEAGWEVLPLWLDIGLGGGEDAAAAAASLGLRLERADIRGALEQYVCAPFASDYLAGRTPLPCAHCNRLVKFPALLSLADRIGAQFVATGHYARCEDGLLKKGAPANDQSYMLARLPKKILPRVIFPLGDYEKTQVRALARSYGLPVAEKRDSMELCFIPDNDYGAWLEKRGNMPPAGDFIDAAGSVLGRHKGIHHYTLGQRRGLGISAESRLFVSDIKPETNQVVLSTGEDLFYSRIVCSNLNWLADAPLEDPIRVTVRLRHTKAESAATLSPGEAGVILELEKPARAPTPGQLAVFYLGDLVLGSAWIESSFQ
ncbi:tRNA-specific 2-thiouridylase MnmA [bioreactor metagenome]|uniref:tRNA-specific 2-thiouridylase MnmA n=1 Tax=bioreactor metagenome TaxID=1076179 RepID=A0A644ZCV3_9ZZZZ